MNCPNCGERVTRVDLAFRAHVTETWLIHPDDEPQIKYEDRDPLETVSIHCALCSAPLAGVDQATIRAAIFGGGER